MTHRQFVEDKLVIASHNKGKIVEIGDLLRPFGVEVVSAGDIDLPEPEETEATFVGNAKLKAIASAKGSGLPALADDSGLCVHGLDNEPGIYSARWAGPNKDFTMAMERVNRKLGDEPNRRAHFVCVLSLCWPGENGAEPHCESFEGTVHGTLVWPLRGSRGFGYDPMFVPDGYTETFGEMDPDHKHEISHRADAFRQLVAACFEKRQLG